MSKTNYIRHLNSVFQQFTKDGNLNPTHISLYMALFQIWNINRFAEVFYINREEIMKFSKIGSKSTYHRCIRDLNNWKYIIYYPSHNPYKGSKIKMLKFETSSGQAEVHNRPKNETSNGQALVSINKHIQTKENNKLNNKQQNLKNQNNNNNLKENENHPPAVPNQDNLKTTKNKNYNEPL
jgi:hypothetical protein